MTERDRLKVGLVVQPSDPAAAETFARISASGMKPASIHRLLANSPQIFSKFIGLAHALRFESLLEPQDRELAILRVLERSGGDYELSHHRPMGLRAGLTQAQIEAAGSAGIDASVFDERQQVILAFADAFAAGAARGAATAGAGPVAGIGPSLAAAIGRHFDDRRVVELGLTMALYLGLAHLTGVIDLPADER